ncbi:hypothetical protein [Oceanospirillum phage vB_OsaM_PD0307]|nr:hypothetical protein [Oceanospirillum phage vB_OsaM_PD0307]
MDFLRLYQHLLPDGRAWRTTIDKRLRQFFQGLTVIPDDVKESADSVWGDLLPETTGKLSDWERQFGLPGNVVGESERRLRLAATWKALIGGQAPRYIQDTLRASGFDVYVHEWWEPSTPPTPGTPGNPTARNPLMWLRREFTKIELLVECGEASAQCGEAFAEAGNSLEPSGYPLVNKFFETVPDLLPLCGEALVECGEDVAACGSFTEYKDVPKEYIVPQDPDRWPYFLYIGGETFGTLAQVDPKRRDEFEALCLKICPTQQWLGVLVEYV